MRGFACCAQPLSTFTLMQGPQQNIFFSGDLLQLQEECDFFMSTIIDSLRSLKQVENLHYCEVQTAALSVTPPCYWICVRRYLENFEGSVWASYWHHKAEAQVWLGERQFLRGAKLYWLRSPNQQNDFLHKVLLNFLQTWNSKIHRLIHNQLHSVQNFETQQLYQFKMKFRQFVVISDLHFCYQIEARFLDMFRLPCYSWIPHHLLYLEICLKNPGFFACLIKKFLPVVLRFFWRCCRYQSDFSTVDSQIIKFTFLSIMPCSKLSAVWIKPGALCCTPEAQRFPWLGAPCQTWSEGPFTVKPESNKNQRKAKSQ